MMIDISPYLKIDRNSFILISKFSVIFAHPIEQYFRMSENGEGAAPTLLQRKPQPQTLKQYTTINTIGD